MSSLISRPVPYGGMKTADGPITEDSKCKVAMGYAHKRGAIFMF